MSDPQIEAFRAFNRFHTRLIGVLNEHLLNSPYGLPQVRVLYEIAHAPADNPPAAADLADALRMDRGHLSRVLSALERDGQITRAPDPCNAKRLRLTLTDVGHDTATKLAAASAAEIGALLAPLGPAERTQLTAAMATIRRLLGDTDLPNKVILRAPEPGDLGYITHAQARLYTQEYGWNDRFEALVSRITADFTENFIPGRERCWIAERDGQIVGSVFIVQKDERTAKLRLLYVDASARGLGLGRRLVEECLTFARAAGYSRIFLWTNDVLVAARGLYQSLGFELTGEVPHSDFGPPMNGQTWERDL
ncbi:bifunctional helix-turn-helix transcriptional regulator/GNAT family N-acetyltransferase [Mesobacterium sp. TK19101]|uniref:Bifunctional helix-turn-helix transcriptional regulator/GNAT family N-acetyltransferase n=1 Tax=Mesobacterium hydrothermale TaxID=3111907 RepID=A0ABU6HJB6_9RHOB|nr:bifunctional helix-turn-helix transcriptional regulator/GNAT family N-acetyltransferase [Mesobacterium sp. TK19101]MEC3861996.1 bifunctional helix-turn-helix transcriptional regulator/GNAT family N-acetyltransferase [Mesobacterium sp. TK19101]